MKRVVKGKLYNTDTATCIGSYEYSNAGDFCHVCEELYRKNNGEYFLAGKGGPKTKYREQVSTRGWSSGEKIIPMTIDEAKDWAEEYLSIDTYIEEFGEPEE